MKFLATTSDYEKEALHGEHVKNLFNCAPDGIFFHPDGEMIL